MWLKLNEAISTLHDDPGIFLFNLVISQRKTAKRRAFRHFHNRGSPQPPPPSSHMVCHQAKRELRVGFCRFSVFFFLRILAKETSFGHVVFFVVTPTVLAMPVSLT